MKNIVVLHVAGSGGDLFSSPLISTGLFYTYSKPGRLLDSGRILPTINLEFVNEFPLQLGCHHYARDWSNDLNQLSKVKRPWLINTAIAGQATLIKNYFQDNVHVIAINYQENLWPLVLKNFCTKVLDVDDYLTRDHVGESFLQVVAKNAQERDYYIQMGRNKQLGYWYAEQALFGVNIFFPPKEFLYNADTVIWFDELLLWDHLKSKLTQITTELSITIDLTEFRASHSAWINCQDQLYFYNWNHDKFQKALGYNCLATRICNASIPLSNLDQLFIQYYLNDRSKTFTDTNSLLEILSVGH